MTLCFTLSAIFAASLIAQFALAARPRPSEIPAPASRKGAPGRSPVIVSERRLPRIKTPNG
jgi:hypothetical protein